MGIKVRLSTDKPAEDIHEEKLRICGQKMQDAVKDKEVLTPPRKKAKEEAEEMPKGQKEFCVLLNIPGASSFVFDKLS